MKSVTQKIEIAAVLLMFAIAFAGWRVYDNHQVRHQRQRTAIRSEISACYDVAGPAMCEAIRDAVTAAEDGQSTRACELYKELARYRAPIGPVSSALLEQTCSR